MRHQESKLQIACVSYFRLAYARYAPMLFAVPNGGWRSAREAQIMKREGVLAGVSDLVLLVSRQGYGALCIELKCERGRPTALQKAWAEEARRAGNRYEIVRSIEEFVALVEDYLST